MESHDHGEKMKNVSLSESKEPGVASAGIASPKERTRDMANEARTNQLVRKTMPVDLNVDPSIESFSGGLPSVKTKQPTADKSGLPDL